MPVFIFLEPEIIYRTDNDESVQLQFEVSGCYVFLLFYALCSAISISVNLLGWSIYAK